MRTCLLTIACGLLAGGLAAQGSAQNPTVRADRGAVVVEWAASSEEQVDHYEVVRRVGDVPVAVGRVEKASADSVRRHRVFDMSSGYLTTAYSVRTVFRNGRSYDSPPRKAVDDGGDVVLQSVVDDPVRSRVYLDVEVASEGVVALTARTLAGRVREELNFPGVAGANRFVVDYADWPAGYYEVVVAGGAPGEAVLILASGPDLTARAAVRP